LYIARLQLKGFKSFGGVHDLPMSPGFTAVVGPNGSGKSNLLDALRWVLGDMNPGRLRIVRQSDLIFSGSLSLPRADEAEVAVQLRSEARSSLFRRKVQRDGTSLVLVDGARVRLQDLDEVKRAWNLEGDRFAFIGQGDVTEVVQQRPLARRMHLRRSSASMCTDGGEMTQWRSFMRRERSLPVWRRSWPNWRLAGSLSPRR
jgi:chromosome segregation protein